MTYALRPGFSFCVVEGTVIFLDVPGDRYFGLSARSSRKFLALSEAAAAGSHIGADFARVFVEQGILVENSEADCWTTSSITFPKREWPASGGSEARPKVRYVVLAFACLLITLLRLRVQSFETMIRARAARTSEQPCELSTRSISSFLAAARFFPWRLDCLPTSLSLRLFLDLLSTPSHLVLAVTLKPFAAHCWIQVGDMVIGDTLERLQDFTPIRRVS